MVLERAAASAIRLAPGFTVGAGNWLRRGRLRQRVGRVLWKKCVCFFLRKSTHTHFTSTNPFVLSGESNARLSRRPSLITINPLSASEDQLQSALESPPRPSLDRLQSTRPGSQELGRNAGFGSVESCCTEQSRCSVTKSSSYDIKMCCYCCYIARILGDGRSFGIM